TTASQPLTASSIFDVALISLGIIISKYFSFLCVVLIASACSSRCVHRRTSCLLSAKTISNAVPQLPAPSTATFAIKSLLIFFFLLQFLLVLMKIRTHDGSYFLKTVYMRNVEVQVHLQTLQTLVVLQLLESYKKLLNAAPYMSVLD